MMSAIERAIEACEASDLDLCEIVGFDELPPDRRAAIIRSRHARAAVASLREPTPEMLRAFMAAAPFGAKIHVRENHALEQWQAAIDAALAESLHHIREVTVVPDTYAFVVQWDDGMRSVKDMTTLIHTRRVFRPLADRDLFSRVQVAEGGRALRWNDDIDVCADALRDEAQEAVRSRAADVAAE